MGGTGKGNVTDLSGLQMKRFHVGESSPPTQEPAFAMCSDMGNGSPTDHLMGVHHLMGR